MIMLGYDNRQQSGVNKSICLSKQLTYSMNRRIQVTKIMTSNPLSVNLTQKISEVIQIFKERSIHHLPVVSGGRVIGIISKTDIDRITFVSGVEENGVNLAVYDMMTIEQVMTKDVETIDEKDLVKDAARILATGKFHALPVVSDGKLTGILTSTDLINHLLEQYE